MMFQIWIEKSVPGEFDDELYCLNNETDIQAFCTLKYKGKAASIGQCGEGGALLVNNPDMIERAQFIRDKGTNRIHFNRGLVDKYTWVELGSSFKESN